MFKKFLFTCSLVICLFFVVACKTNQTDGPGEDTKEYPRFSDISILESVKEEGAIDVFVKALDTDALVYLIVVEKDAKAPTNEAIKKHETYEGVAIVSYLEGTGTIYKTIQGLEQGKAYDIYVTLFKNNIFAKEFYKTTCLTKTLDEVLDKGSGTNEDPYKIFSIEDLEKVASDAEGLTAFYSLQNDLDLSSKYSKDLLSFVPLSWQTGSLKAFNGYFNGNGHTIKNLYIKETKESVGLFGQLGEEGTVANLVLENPEVSTTGQRLGAVVGYNKGSIVNVSVIGGKVESLVPEGGQAKAGGLVGDMYESGSILRCVSKTTVVALGNNVGGISGSADASTGKTKALEIKNCYSLSDVQTMGKYAGGIVGYARCVEIENCYTLGTVEGGEGVGGIVGFLQQRNGSPIVPSTKNCFVLGSTITANGKTQSNNSGIVIGNRSTSNNTNPVVEQLYYADSTLLGNQKKPQSIGEEVEASVFANKDWLKTNLNLDCNGVYWTLKTDANRPTLVHASWDDGAYQSPLRIKSLKVSVPDRKQLTIEAQSSEGSLYYVVVYSTAKAPTAEQIIAQKDYEDVKLVGFGTSTDQTLNATIQDLEDDTSYTIYVVAKADTELSTVSSVTQKTLPAPILLETSYEVKDGTNLGEISITITSNKNVTTYYKVSKEKLTLTKEDMITFASVTSTTIAIRDLDENTEYYIYLYSSTADEDVDIEEVIFTTKADPVPFEVTVDFSKTVNPKELELTLTANKPNADLWYILSGDLSLDYTKEELMAQGNLYRDNKVVFDNLEDNKEYKIFVYGKTNTRETEVITKVATTLDTKYEQFADYFVGDWNQPGLFDKNGVAHEMPTPVEESGDVISVLDHGAIANDSTKDNYEAFKKAIDAAKAGDTIYIPNGTYYFTSSVKENGYYAHIHLKSGITLKGETKEGVILVSCFTPTENEEKQTTVIAVTNASNVAIKNLTVTSNTGDLEYDQNDSNLITDILTGPKYGITLASSKEITTAEEQTRNVVIDNVIVEKFRRAGVRISMAQENIVRNSLFRNATCLGGGGMGYGVSIQGETHDVNRTDTILDTRFNVVEDCSFEGPYLRHGVLIQYYAHNNLVHHNTFHNILLDSIDLHGEDEYSNEICHNEILNTRRGAAVGLGNTGATHDATGRNNFIHDNLIDGGARAIDVMLNTPNTVIFANTIQNVEKGITCSLANGTRIVGNTFTSVTENSIQVNYAFVWGAANLGIPRNCMIKDNIFTSCGKGIVIDTKEDFVIEGNQFEQIDSANQIVDTTDTFVLPENDLAISVLSDDDAFTYTLNVTTTKTDVKVYYLISTLSTAPTKEEVLAETPSESLAPALEGLNRGTTYYVYVICATNTETSVMLSTSFETAEEIVQPLTLSAKITTNTADGVTAKYAQAGATFETTAGATVHYVLTDTVIENPTVEILNGTVQGKIVIKGETLENAYLFTGLTSETTYYLYAYATLEDQVSSIVSKEVTTAVYRHFNKDRLVSSQENDGTYKSLGTINIYNAEDFYNYVEYSRNGFMEDEVLKTVSNSVNVTLFGNIYLEVEKPIQKITLKSSDGKDTGYTGTFDGKGFTIYNFTMKATETYLGLYYQIAAKGSFKDVTFDHASVINTYAGTSTSVGTGILAADVRGTVTNIIIKNSNISTTSPDSRVGSIAGRIANTGILNQIAVYNTVVKGVKYVGGIAGHIDYSSDNVTTITSIQNSYIDSQSTIYGNSDIGGIVGHCRATIANVVSLASMEKNEAGSDFKNCGMIIGSINKSTKKEPPLPNITSVLSYKEGKIVGSHQNSVVWINEEDVHTILQVGSVNKDEGKQTVVSLEELTEEYLKVHTSFLKIPEGQTKALWELTEDHQLVLRLGDNN